MSLPQPADLENHMVIPQVAARPFYAEKSNADIIEDSAVWVAEEAQHIEQMDGCIDCLINLPNFEAMVVALLDPKRSKQQLKHLRQYMLDQALELEVIKRGGEFDVALNVVAGEVL